MKLHWNGIEWDEDKYLFWFDWISVPQNRLVGYEKIYIDGKCNHMMCFWFFCTVWSF